MEDNKNIFIRQIPPYGGIIILVLASLFVAWFTISIGEKIIKDTPQSNIYASQRSAQKMIDNLH